MIDGGAGPCSLELTVSGADAKPVYNATVKVHITYGFGGFHHLDLQAGTNSDGKVKFTGIPAKVHNPPLEFDANKEQLEGSVNYDPSTECHGKHEVKINNKVVAFEKSTICGRKVILFLMFDWAVPMWNLRQLSCCSRMS